LLKGRKETEIIQYGLYSTCMSLNHHETSYYVPYDIKNHEEQEWIFWCSIQVIQNKYYADKNDYF